MLGASARRLLTAGVRALGVEVPSRFEAVVSAYLDELAHWSRVGRLTGYASDEDQVRHLVLESLMVLRVLTEDAEPLLDIGSGAGAPGLVLAMARPDWRVTLVEARRRRANFLRAVGRRVALDALVVLHRRAEDLVGEGYRGRFRAVTLRAVAPTEDAARLGLPFLGPGGRLVIALGPEGPKPGWSGGDVREVSLGSAVGTLPGPRRFLILRADQQGVPNQGVSRGTPGHDVSRETQGASGAGHRGGEPEGRGGKDDHRGQSGHRTGAGRPKDATG